MSYQSQINLQLIISKDCLTIQSSVNRLLLLIASVINNLHIFFLILSTIDDFSDVYWHWWVNRIFTLWLNYERISYTLIESSDESRLGPFLIVKPSGLFVSEGQGSLRPPVNASVFWSKVGQTVRLFNSKVYRAFQNNLEGESWHSSTSPPCPQGTRMFQFRILVKDLLRGWGHPSPA